MRVCNGLLRRKVENRELLIFGAVLESRSSAIIEIYHDAGYDSVLIDREHSCLNDETISDHIRAARLLEFPCMVRVAEDCYHELNRTLDQGADGIFVPRIKTRKQVENLIQTVKYKPFGHRGLGASSCPVGKYKGWSTVREQVETVNKNLVIGIQIETAEALDDLDGILSVEGLDMAVIGCDDLTMGLEIPGELRHPKFLDAVMRIIDACNRHNVMPGIAAGDPDVVADWIKKGMKVIWYTSDTYLMSSAAERQIGCLRERMK